MNGAVTSENLPQNRAAVTVNKDDPYPDVVARPLNMPDFINFVHRNTAYVIRWGNRTAGNGQRLDELIYAGYRPAKPEEVVSLTAPECTTSLRHEGQIWRGDLICLIIDAASYNGALKHNWSRAVGRLHPDAAVKTGQAQVNKAVSEAGVPTNLASTLKSKLQVFKPGATEAEGGTASATK